MSTCQFSPGSSSSKWVHVNHPPELQDAVHLNFRRILPNDGHPMEALYIPFLYAIQK